jgi:magnesium-protoporphyrin O-methyltransferase
MTKIQEHCCGADLFFDEKIANKEYKTYLKNGPSRVTSKIISQIEKVTIKGKSLVDVGGGIGAIQWWFLQNGGQETVDIDASSGYIKKAQEHANKNNWNNRTQFIMGNCTDVYDQVAPSEFITLDKVICCYPDYEEILEATCGKSKAYVSVSYPMDGLISNAIRALGALFFLLKKNPYRPYVHAVSSIRATFNTHGYERVAHDLAFPWHIETYRKDSI